MSVPETRPATTVLLLREGVNGVEVFLVKRHGKSRFMPDMWVFPGGRVDDDDHHMPADMVTGGEWTASRLGLTEAEATGFLVAGVRETFEEAGIWLGQGELPEALRHPLNNGEVRFCDLLAAHQATIDLGVLRPWAWWVTPDSESRRYDTRFVVATTDSDGSHDDGETVDSGWFRPADALSAIDAGNVRMAPPTWWVVQELKRLAHVDAVLAHTEDCAIARIQPILALGQGTVRLTLPGHPEHPDDAIEGLPSEIVFEKGKWWAAETYRGEQCD